jgi:hypothetical protein
VKFDQLTKKKKSFNQTPNLTENFDQLKMSSEIGSSYHSPKKLDLNWRNKNNKNCGKMDWKTVLNQTQHLYKYVNKYKLNEMKSS